MPRIDHNGANFRYAIEYQRLNNANTFDTVTETVEDFHQERLVVSGQATYQPYRIRVRSVNDEGEASDDVTQEIVGFSGEDGEFGWQYRGDTCGYDGIFSCRSSVPRVVPENFELVGEPKAKRANFSWSAVDASRKNIRGFFRGYRVRIHRISYSYLLGFT